ncbi:MAG: sugar-binding domain-containing protein, partial [Planctomycetota bacterium]
MRPRSTHVDFDPRSFTLRNDTGEDIAMTRVDNGDGLERNLPAVPPGRRSRFLAGLQRLVAAVCVAVLSTSAVDAMDKLNLAGEWAFEIDEQDVGIEQRWYARTLADTINLPGSMPEQRKGKPVGYDTEFTGNMWKEYPEGQTWRDDENYKPYLKDDEFRFPFWLVSDFHYVGAAWYQTTVDVPADWAGSDIELMLERCHWETQVWVNEAHIGQRDALGVPHRYQLGDALQAGVNTITIRVDNRVKDIEVGLDAHSISDNTQSNWNGIVGKLELTRRAPVSIENVQIFPDVAGKSVRLEIELSNISGAATASDLQVSARVVHPEPGPMVEPMNAEVEIAAGSASVTLEYALGDGVLLWDEFEPNLYELSVGLRSDQGTDTWAGTFGMREIRATPKSLWINDRPLFLRGTLECAIFPKTGYPPTTVEPWERLIRIAQRHGLNHIRFHSWCPPRVAFEAADRLGFYLQAEASAWAGDIGSGKPIDQWVYDESERMVAEYGNHPSFVLMPYGNEPHGPDHKAFLTEFVRHWKAKDNRRLYTAGAGWPITDENDFHNIYHGARIQGWNANLNSIINREPPRSDYDWGEKVSQLDAPVVSHEIGQWCVYPNFREIPKYDGVLKATNFEIFRDSLDARGLLHLADDYVRASGRLQALCYKADIEAALRTVGFGGFQLLDIRDFTGQGTALVGILDPFWDEKGYISPEEFRQFSHHTVPLARLPKHVYVSGERIECEIEVAHYGPREIEGVTPTWRITDRDGSVVRKGAFDTTRLAWGNGQTLGMISEVFDVATATQMRLEVEVAGATNAWDFWVYPRELPEAGSDVLIARTLDDAAAKRLEQGGKVLLTIEKGSIRNGMGGEVGIGFSSMFWNTAWTNGQLPHTLGILCDPEHAALRKFPTEFHSNWQWWDAMSHSNAISLEAFETTPEPIVRVIDDWVTNRNLGLIFELRVGEGRLLVSGVDLV